MGSVLYNIIILPVQYLIQLIFSTVWLMTYNAGVSIIAVSAAVNLLCLPLYKRADAMQEEERIRQEKMKPWIDHIGKYFSGDERFMMRQVYYREQKYSPLSPMKGMVSLLLQIPFLIAAYRFLSTLPILNGESFWIFSDLSQPDGLLRIGSLSINVLPVLMTVFNLLSSVIYTKGLSFRERLQPYVIAIAFLIFLYPCPSGLVFYWTLNNLFSLLKNVFLKVVKNPEKVLSIISALCGAAILIWSLSSGALLKTVGANRKEADAGHIVLIIAVVLITLIPLAKLLFGKKIKQPDLPDMGKGLWVISGILSAAVFGGIIPLSLVASSAVEFVDYGTGTMPLDTVLVQFCIALGIFVFWWGVVYLTADEKGKKYVTIAAAAIPPVIAVDFMIFGKTFGTLSTDLLYSEMIHYSPARQLLNIAGIVILAAVVVYLCCKHKRILFLSYVALSLAAFSLCASSVMKVKNDLAKAGLDRSLTASASSETVELKGFRLSRTGKNVVVIMLDRAIGSFVPDIMEERPELKEGFKDFTWYKQTISFGAHTNFGSPELFGGYEYTPQSMNERSDERLADKHNESLKVLPELFSENGYHITVCDLPYAGYSEVPSEEIFKDINDTDCIFINDGQCISSLSEEEKSEITASGGGRNWRFFMYEVMKSLPISLNKFVYSKGKYMSVTNIPTDYINNYAAMKSLPALTEISDDEKGCVLLMNNEMTHEVVTLQLPDYTYRSHASNDEYAGGYHGLSSWHTEVRAFMCLNDWFDLLKKEGVWDNTRIILASDHGFGEGAMVLDDGYDAQAFMALLLVKDFDSDNTEMTEDDEFITIADVPRMAAEGAVNAAVNPYTKKPLEADEAQKADPKITGSENYVITENNGDVFDTGSDSWYSVHGDIYDKDSWEILGPDNAASN